MKLIDESTNATGDVYTLFSFGKRFKTVIHYVERTNKRGTMKAETLERTHRYLEAALNSKLRNMFSFKMKACVSCTDQTDVLFAPFDEGDKIYCSNCQMDAENAINEENDNDWGD
jgi:hypothetical protein